MVRQPMPRNAFAALGVAALLAILAFLLEHALSTEFHPDARALSLLRELSDVESRRDAEAERLAATLDAASLPATDNRAATSTLVRRELERASAASSVAPRLSVLRRALDAKDAAFQDFRRAHGNTVVALQALETPLATLEQAAQSSRSRNADASLALASLVEAIRQDVHRGDIERLDDSQARLAARAPLVVSAAMALDPALGVAARHAHSTIEAFAVARHAEAQAWHAFAWASSGEQIQLAARMLERRIDQALDEREQWRVYLVAYACALAVGLSYVFFRLSTRLGAARRERDALAALIAEQQTGLATAQADQERVQAQLVSMGRYWSIGQLTAGISQEIARPLAAARTHLSAIRSALPDLRGAHDQAQRLVDLLRSTQSDPRQVDKAVSALANHLQHLRRHNAIDDIDALAWGGLRDVEHIAELMAQLRGFFRAESPAATSFNVNDAVQAALLIATPLLQSLRVEKALGDIPAIACRPGEMIQLMLSLVARAAQSAQRPGGQVRITTRRLDDGVAVDVWNEGELRPDDGDLAIARQIVARHAGGIAVRASEEGTLIAVELPHGTARVAA